MKRKRNSKSKAVYEHYWCMCTIRVPWDISREEDAHVREIVCGIASELKARSLVMSHERRAMFTVTNTSARCSLVGREPGVEDRRVQIFMKQPTPLTEREFQEMRKSIEADGGRMGRPFKGVMGFDPTDGMNYFRGNGTPDWLKTTAAILLEAGDGPVGRPQYAPASWTGEGYHTERDRNGTLKTLHAYGDDLNELAEIVRRDFPELKDAELKKATDSDLAKCLLDMPDYDLMTFLRRHGNNEVYMGDLPELRENLTKDVKP
jgi:hypothetical protein